MQTREIILVGLMSIAGTACKDIDCGAGTIEKSGTCVPADETVGPGTCGPFTELQGDKCVPMFTPTECDTATTTPVVDPTTGVTTCVGNGGGGGCSAPVVCPAPAAGKQSICGQLYDLETDMPFQAANPVGAKCTAGATSGPCALGIVAYDAVSFASGPSSATPLTVGSVTIDDCGHYRVENISPPSGPYLALGIDDALAANMGPPGVTNAVGVATNTLPNSVTNNFDGFIVTKAATDMWTSTGGGTPNVGQGMIVNIYRSHETGEGEQSGVTFCRTSGSTCTAAPNDDFYFMASDTGRHTIDPTATSTGMNGTAIVINDALAQGADNSGEGGFQPNEGCVWNLHPAQSLAGIVFAQVKRPQDDFMGDTCDR